MGVGRKISRRKNFLKLQRDWILPIEAARVVLSHKEIKVEHLWLGEDMPSPTQQDQSTS